MLQFDGFLFWFPNRLERCPEFRPIAGDINALHLDRAMGRTCVTQQLREQLLDLGAANADFLTPAARQDNVVSVEGQITFDTP